MSSWDDLFAAETNEPPPIPGWQTPAPAPGEAEPTEPSPEAWAMAEAVTWRCDQGEPPPHIVRWKIISGPNSGVLGLARCAEGGWWWTAPGQVASRKGWPWSNVHAGMKDAVLAPDYPDLTHTNDAFDRSLCMALPSDGRWYRIGTTVSNNGPIPVWGTHDGDGDTDTEASETRPDDDDDDEEDPF
jgi:hypothetical protein